MDRDRIYILWLDIEIVSTVQMVIVILNFSRFWIRLWTWISLGSIRMFTMYSEKKCSEFSVFQGWTIKGVQQLRNLVRQLQLVDDNMLKYKNLEKRSSKS